MSRQTTTAFFFFFFGGFMRFTRGEF